MADKTTTLTTQTGDSIYPNVLDENIPDTIARVSDVNKLKTDVEANYLTNANAEATYQTKAGRADYVSKTYGDGTYATIIQLGGKQDKLTAGSNITIEGATIAATRPENMALYGDLAATDEEFTGGGSSGGATGGGGVSPTLNLMNENLDATRTSITEEEAANLEKGLYNSVLYMDLSLGEAGFGSLYFPENAIFISGEFIFSIYKVVLTDEGSSGSIISSRIYHVDIKEKSADGTYPITIEMMAEFPFGDKSSSSNLPVLDLSEYEDKVLTDEQITAIENTEGSLVNIKLPGQLGSIIPETLNIGIVEKKDGVDVSNTSIILLSSPFINILNEL